MHVNLSCAVAVGIVALGASGCGGSGGGGGNSNQSPLTPAPTVAINANPASVTQGQTTLLSWTSTNATSCTASGGWTGSMPTSGNEISSVLHAVGAVGFSLSCSGLGGITQDSVTVSVTAGPGIAIVPCYPTAPPPELDLDTFYQKYCDADGIPVVSSMQTPDEALQWVANQARGMLQLRPELLSPMRGLKTIIGIMSVDEVTTDIPEHSDLYEAFPDVDWDARARGLGATPVRPASTAAEENVLCYTNDPYRGESIFVHEFAHTIHVMGIRQIDSSFDSRLKAAYDAAIAAGLWSQTYAATNELEYWAEGVQSWFNVNLKAVPPDGIHNHVNTRSELAAYDPALHQLIAEFMPASHIPLCPEEAE